jgi:hypothetical protein
MRHFLSSSIASNRRKNSSATETKENRGRRSQGKIIKDFDLAK